MKKRFLSLVLALALCLGLAVPAMAYNTGKVGEYNNIISATSRTAAIDENSSLWMWGNNGSTEGALVPVKVLDNVATVSCGANHTAAIKTDRTLWVWDSWSNGSPDPVKVMDNAVAVSCGFGHTAAIKTDGTLWTWGSNGLGQLGNGSTTNSSVPVKVLDNVAAVSCGEIHTAAIKTDGTLWMWGMNHFSELGNGGGGNSSSSIDGTECQTVPLQVLDNVAAVSCGSSYTAAIKTDGSLWMWGLNEDGQLGNGGSGNAISLYGFLYQAFPVKVMDDVVAVSCGQGYTAAIKADGTLWMWGDNEYGQLGNGSTTNSSVPVKVMDNVAAVSCGSCHTIAVKTDGTLWTWGANVWGQLGNGGGGNANVDGTPSQTVPVQITLGSGVSLPKGVRLYLDGGTGGGLLWTNASGTIQVPTNPTKPGYTFAGWYTDAALTIPWNFNNPVSGTLALYARWNPVSSTAATTTENSQTVTVNGTVVDLQGYTLVTDGGGDVTYVRLRDMAALLNGTSAQFDVDWRNNTIYVETGARYVHQAGNELQPIQSADRTYRWNTAPILFDGETAPLEGIVITDTSGGDNTFFKLRDLGQALNFYVGWTQERGIYIETDKPYSE